MKCFKKAQNSVRVHIDSMLPIHRDRVGNMKIHIYTIHTQTHTFFSKLVMIVASKEGNGVLRMGMEKGLPFAFSVSFKFCTIFICF